MEYPTDMTTVAFIVPFRDRGKDPRRPANLKRVTEHWNTCGQQVLVVDDGRTGDAQFNRSAAYNRAATQTTADVLVFTESDLIVPFAQIEQGIKLAVSAPGLVVPFSKFLAITEQDSIAVREHRLEPAAAQANQIRKDRQSIGAVNIVSRESLNLIGQYDEAFEGAWYDDDAMELAFRVCCGPTRFVDGPGFHLYHLSGGGGKHLTTADKAATERNKQRFDLYRAATTPERIRELTAG
ncbi:galactosyl transferase [Mycobacterium phage ThetaBob]|uniref:Galactosyltransferase n=1 Tax=Mycobacterium phage ThetaBob TaxID=2588513 RepID=A0A4Y6EQK0_9CAUD|nr:galactosyl transferase [Mycobacterium phage ThetaBob]QDF19991.1 galactosyltransferase [Mycobacterium phage ThetaBob]